MNRVDITPKGCILCATRATPMGGTRYAAPLVDLGRIGRKGRNGLSQASEREDSIEGGRNSPVAAEATRVNGGVVK